MLAMGPYPCLVDSLQCMHWHVSCLGPLLQRRRFKAVQFFSIIIVAAKLGPAVGGLLLVNRLIAYSS